MVSCGWDDVPHLDAQTKLELLESTPPHLRDARSKGIPSLGSGAIYPIPESEFVVPPFAIPAYWPRAYGMDVGWKKTAVTWGAWDLEVDCLYLYAEHYRGETHPSTHTTSVKARGEWIRGVIDPAAHGRAQDDGEQLLIIYRELGLDLTPADNAVEAGIYDVLERLSTGRLKVFASLMNWLAEYRIYRRDEKGKIVKAHDHLMDASRYLVRSGAQVRRTRPLGNTIATRRAADAVIGY